MSSGSSSRHSPPLASASKMRVGHCRTCPCGVFLRSSFFLGAQSPMSCCCTPGMKMVSSISRGGEGLRVHTQRERHTKDAVFSLHLAPWSTWGCSLSTQAVPWDFSVPGSSLFSSDPAPAQEVISRHLAATAIFSPGHRRVSRQMSRVLQKDAEQESQMRAEIQDMKQELSTVNMMDEFARYARLERKINKMTDKLKTHVKARTAQLAKIKWVMSVAFYILQVVLELPVGFWSATKLWL
ncbi:guided entry of tail-anchored proteins factor 1 isoform X1 [Manis javanica]|uniref:guided entry of tail-anchored proteins factor 1 isoform X1 n=1 Tax=Manis javanica TaxID=9974 RepID=UPI003C6D25AE